mmetsp:Transcript_42801/g.74323  ORF Transcript_42801/g.74323 Transcript_42801/m.74323 type:complete len:91 (-) Transcript_42801:40-312(-)
MDIFCVSQPALVGCDDDAQISGEHEEEGEHNVSLSLQLFSVNKLGEAGRQKKGRLSIVFLLLLALFFIVQSHSFALPIFFIWFNLTDKAC